MDTVTFDLQNPINSLSNPNVGLGQIPQKSHNALLRSGYSDLWPPKGKGLLIKADWQRRASHEAHRDLDLQPITS